MRVVLHLTWTLMLVLTAASAHAQQAQAPATTAYSVFLRGMPVGTENASVTTDAAGTTIRSEGRFGPPLNITLRSAEIRYSADWSPLAASADASFNGND